MTRPLRSTFLPTLNALLVALALPFSLDHPTDLTPSLLLAIFESLISARLPIPPAIRQSRTRDAQARAMLVLLGVLECDILRGGTDTHPDSASIDDSVLAGVSVDGWADEIGLGEVDPERLADGAWEETIFIGELLCWLARRKGILPRNKSSHRSSRSRSLYSNYHSYGDSGDSADLSTSLLLRPSPPSPSIPDTDHDFSVLSHITDVPRHPLVRSPEPSFSASATTGTDLSIRARSVSSRTTVSNPHDDTDLLDEASHDTTQMYDPRQMMQDAEDDDDHPPTFRPHCIHELEDPSYIRAQSPSYVSQDDDDPCRDHDNDDPYAPPTPTPRRVRLTGWIEPVDAATEFNHFAASRARSRGLNSSADSGAGPPSHTHSRTHALASSTSHPKTKTEPSSRSRPSCTPRRSSPIPSPPRPTATSRCPPTRTPSPLFSPSPPSPPSPPVHSDPPFDVSFSTLNNTSTPAKPRASRRPLSRSQTSASAGAAVPRHPERSPSRAPSPPSFSTPGVRPPGSKGVDRGARASSQPSGSTVTMTSTLLTERARLLTELAALKRARGASAGGASAGTETRAGSSNSGVGRRRVGVGV